MVEVKNDDMSQNVLKNADRFFAQFLAYDNKGKYDTKKAAKLFEEAFTAWVHTRDQIKPIIVQELTEYGRLGEGNLIRNVLHTLKLPPTKDNTERVQTAVQELQKSGRIEYQTPESGVKRGRNVGWVLSGAEAA